MSERNAGLSQEFVDQQRQRLEALRAQLLGAEENADENARAFQAEHGEEAQESGDMAQEMMQNEVNQARHDVDKRRLSKIERALKKIAEGNYGLSDMSGKPIPRARLDATPEAIDEVQENRREENE